MSQAANAIGQSSWSQPATFTTQATVPVQPAAPVEEGSTEDSVTVGWAAPYDCGAPISDYQLECDDGRGGPFSKVFTGLALQRSVPGLQVGAFADLGQVWPSVL